jgi:hypothetical protein
MEIYMQKKISQLVPQSHIINRLIQTGSTKGKIEFSLLFFESWIIHPQIAFTYIKIHTFIHQKKREVDE